MRIPPLNYDLVGSLLHVFPAIVADRVIGKPEAEAEAIITQVLTSILDDYPGGEMLEPYAPYHQRKRNRRYV